MPAAQTGGDTYDLALLPQGLLVVLGDATGHGIAPALSVLQMHAMLRTAMRLGVTLEAAFTQVNDQLAEVLPDSQFVTAFIGLLDVHSHRLRFLSGGQGPILHFRAAQARCESYRATSFPMGAMPITRLRPAVEIDLAPDDWLAVLSDGIYEHEDADGQALGAAAVEQLLAKAHADTAAGMAAQVLKLLQAFVRGAPQEDDITMALVNRKADVTAP